MSSLTAPTPSPAPAPAPAANDDDEWSFSSALPPGVPDEHSATLSNKNLKIDMVASRKPNDPSIHLRFAFTNNTAEGVSELHFQLAVTKVCHPFRIRGQRETDIVIHRATNSSFNHKQAEPWHPSKARVSRRP